MREIPAHLYKDPASGCQDNSPHRVRTGFVYCASRQVSLSMDSIIAQGTFHPATGTDETATYLCFNTRISIPSLFIFTSGKDRSIMACPPASSTVPYVLQDQRYSVFKVHPTATVAIPTPDLSVRKVYKRHPQLLHRFPVYVPYENDKCFKMKAIGIRSYR